MERFDNTAERQRKRVKVLSFSYGIFFVCIEISEIAFLIGLKKKSRCKEFDYLLK